jgi:voltage-gated potassium channel Kch
MKLDNIIQWHVHDRFRYLLASLVLFIVLPPFLIDLPILKYAILLLLVLVILGCTMVLFDRSKRAIYSLLITAVIIWFSLEADSNYVPYEIFKLTATIVFFIATARKIVIYVLKVERVTPNVILGSIAAYVLLGLVAAVLFQLIEAVYPNSFNVPLGYENFYKMIYFSFVTMSTLGYGDITPQSPQAGAITILIAVSGQLYLAVLMAMLVGKFLHDQKK